MLNQPGGTPFQLKYNNAPAKAVREGTPASTGNNLNANPPAFDPRQMQAQFIKGSTNALKSGFNVTGFNDPSTTQSLINKAGTNSNFGDFGNTFDPKNENNIKAQNFLNLYKEGVTRNLINQPVDETNLSPFMSKKAPYQDDSFMNVAKPFPGGDPSKIE